MEDVFFSHCIVIWTRQGSAKLRMTVSAQIGIPLKCWEKVSLLTMDLALWRCLLGPYFVYYHLLPLICSNLFVYLFPIDVNYDKLLPMFGSIYLLRIIHKSFSIWIEEKMETTKKHIREPQAIYIQENYVNMFICCFVVVVVVFFYSSSVCVGEQLSGILWFYFPAGFIWANGTENDFPFNSSWFQISLNWQKHLFFLYIKMLLTSIFINSSCNAIFNAGHLYNTSSWSSLREAYVAQL